MKIVVNKADAYIKESETLTSGRAGLEVQFEFSNEWEDLSKTAVFTCGNTTKYVVLNDNKCIVPYECLTTAGLIVICGIYGSNGSDIIIPTIYCALGLVVEGTTVSGQESGEITPSLYDQVVALLHSASDELSLVKETKVIEAKATVDAVIGTPSVSVSYEWIDEEDHSQGKRLILAFSGLKGGKGDPGNPGYTPRKNIDYFDGDDGFSPVVSSEVIPNGHRVDITDATHTESINIMNGNDGISPTVTVETTETGSKIIITDRDGTKEVEILNGVDGDDGFDPIIEVEDIAGGHRVKITDATHTEVFDVLNGRDGEGSGDMLASVYDPQGKAQDIFAYADKKMEYYMVTYTGSTIQHDGVTQTYADLVAKYYDEKVFLYAEAYGLTMIPTLPPYEGDNILEFICTWIENQTTTISRLIINEQNQVKFENIEMAEKTDLPTKTSELTNDSGYLTQHQDISGKQDKITSANKLAYSLLSGTPTIPTKTSDLTNDSGYLTQHQSLANYYTKTEIDGMIGNVESLLSAL